PAPARVSAPAVRPPRARFPSGGPGSGGRSLRMIRAVVWNEGLHERDSAEVRAVYPEGLHEALAKGLRERDGDGPGDSGGIVAETALLGDPEHGLPEERLAATDVLLWWGHRAHEQVEDAVAERVQKHVLSGMG